MKNVFCSLMLLLLACGSPRIVSTGGTDGGSVAAYRGLIADPPQLAFTCVTPGCDTTLSVKVSSNVNRRVAIKRVVLSQANADYTVTPSEVAPFILGAASDFDVTVRLLPKSAPSAVDEVLLVTYTDAAVDDSPDRIEPGELNVQLVRRLVGEPVLTATPSALSFGVVPVGSTKLLPVAVANTGFGNIALAVDGYDAGQLPLTVTLPAVSALVPDAGASVSVTFSPTVEQYLKGPLELTSSTSGVDPVWVQVEGTSYSWPHVILEPEETAIDFGPVPRGTATKVTVHIANVGGQTLTITNVGVTDALNDLSAQLPGGTTSGTLDPLQRLDVTLVLDGGTAGVLAGSLNISSSDPVRPQLTIPVTGTVTAPVLQATPDGGAWGTLPMGWVVDKSFEVRNVGYGALTVKHISFVGTSSSLFSLKNVPALPVTLQRDQRATFDVEFSAQTAAPFTGAVSIESDDPTNPFLQVPLTATGAACGAACPIANGTSSCASGTCGVGTCNSGWYDSNQSPADGCECQLVGSTPAAFCSSGVNKGSLSDKGTSATYSGNLPGASDVQYVSFFGQDDSSLGETFGDNFDVKIRIVSGDPNVQMCVDWQESTTFTCNSSNETCATTFEHKGSYGHSDNGSYVIKVFRKAGAPATCAPYTVYMSNG